LLTRIEQLNESKISESDKTVITSILMKHKLESFHFRVPSDALRLSLRKSQRHKFLTKTRLSSLSLSLVDGNAESDVILIHTADAKGWSGSKFSNNSQIDLARVRRKRARTRAVTGRAAGVENQLQAIASLAGIYS